MDRNTWVFRSARRMLNISSFSNFDKRLVKCKLSRGQMKNRSASEKSRPLSILKMSKGSALTAQNVHLPVVEASLCHWQIGGGNGYMSSRSPMKSILGRASEILPLFHKIWMPSLGLTGLTASWKLLLGQLRTLLRSSENDLVGRRRILLQKTSGADSQQTTRWEGIFVATCWHHPYCSGGIKTMRVGGAETDFRVFSNSLTISSDCFCQSTSLTWSWRGLLWFEVKAWERDIERKMVIVSIVHTIQWGKDLPQSNKTLRGAKRSSSNNPSSPHNLSWRSRLNIEPLSRV